MKQSYNTIAILHKKCQYSSKDRDERIRTIIKMIKNKEDAK